MAIYRQLLLWRLRFSKPLFSFSFLVNQTPMRPVRRSFTSLPTSADSTQQTSTTPNPTSLSSRMSFIFDQIDEIDKNRDEKHQTLQRIRSWRQSNNQPHEKTEPSAEDDLKTELVKSEILLAKKEVEVVHPWAEWIELMDRLVQQNYFDHRRKDEDGMMEGLGLDLSDAASLKEEDKGLDLMRDFKTVQAAMVNFGKDRFDILRSLSRQDLQILVGYGCASTDKKVVFSSKLLRKHVHLNEGDVCSSCSLRSTCEKGYLLTNKEDEARTIDIMRILLAFGFDPIDGSSVVNKSVLKMKSVKNVVRKLLHEVVKLSAVPIDPNLPPPVIRKPPPKIKQPPPPPKKRVGRNDIEMKKGDWLCPKCDFMNFAKNTVCMQCDAKRPKRQLLPGEWECPQCNFLNYRRNTVCFHCEHNRPPDTYAPSQFVEKQHNPRIRTEKAEVSNAWNFDFDDNESDGADVAAFEYADSRKLEEEDFPLSKQQHSFVENSRPPPNFSKREYSDSIPIRSGTGFNDFDEDEDDDDVDSYDLVPQNEVSKTPRVNFSELEADSESEDIENANNDKWRARRKNSSPPPPTRSKKFRKASSVSDSEVDFDSDDDLPVHPNWKSSHVAADHLQHKNSHRGASRDNDFGFSSSSDDESLRSKNRGGNNNRWGSNRGVKNDQRVTRGRSHNTYDDSDDDDYRNNGRRDKAGRDYSGKASMRRGSDRRSSSNNSFSRSSGFQRNNDSYNEPTGRRERGSSNSSSKFQSRGGTGSFDKRRGGRGGRSNSSSNNRSDSFEEDEVYRRPRVNVR
ncbi:hypothetical protein ACJIZ3_015948 [Penstemon smallii]|uniref:RanBP2-type domain-containing protein n=1 Tax=Penstemon smallii TaxID=265156 RepID=A0ABD3RUS3_9LAMI